MSNSVPEKYLKDQTGITTLEKTADWLKNYDPSKPLSGTMDLVMIFAGPAILSVLVSFIWTSFKKGIR